MCLRKPGTPRQLVHLERPHCGSSFPLRGSILGPGPALVQLEEVYFSVSCGCGEGVTPHRRVCPCSHGYPACVEEERTQGQAEVRGERGSGRGRGALMAGHHSKGRCAGPCFHVFQNLGRQALSKWNAGLRPAWASPTSCPPVTSCFPLLWVPSLCS